MIDREDKIRQRAYSIWEEEGHPQGRAESHWHRAVREVQGDAPAEAKPLPHIGAAPSLQPAEKPAAPQAKAASGVTSIRKRTAKTKS